MSDPVGVLWVVMRAVSWRSIEVAGYPAMPMATEEKMGNRFLPIFDSREDAERCYPGSDVLPIAAADMAEGVPGSTDAPAGG